MTTDDGPGARVRAAAGWLDASPVEVVGLAVLLVGAAAVAGVVWWTGLARPGTSPAAVPSPPALTSPTATPSTVTVHVTGSVAAPGLVELPGGSRVADALTAAGGARGDADLDALNLARLLIDGEQLHVPAVGETATAAPSGAPSAAGAWRADGLLDLNLATEADLDELPGIGPVLAARIIDWRDANGPFTDVAQLREVSGIGDATFEELAPLVTV